MKEAQIRDLLEQVKDGDINIDEAVTKLRTLPYEDMGYAKVDYHRELRSGFPEVIYSPGKTLEQIQGIVGNMLKRSDGNILASRADEKVYEAICQVTDQVVYYKDARCVVVKRQ